MDEKSNVVVLKEFFNKGTSRPVSMVEMSEFWKGLSESEKVEFGAAARKQIS